LDRGGLTPFRIGTKPPERARFDGLSLAPILKGKEQPELARRMAVVQYGGLDPTRPQKWDAAVLWNRWRLVGGKELYEVEKDPGQEHDVAGEHPEVVRKMRERYEAWWAGVEPGLDDLEAVVLGSDRENTVRLSSLDWMAPKLVPAAQPCDIRQLGVPVVEGSLPLGRPMPLMNAPWNVEIAREGTYEIALRRWPKEADAPITAPLPAHEGVDGTYPPGKALPAARARLKVAGGDLSRPVGPGDKAVTFTARLPAGKTRLQTWFYDARGKELCGAFYVIDLSGEFPMLRIPGPLQKSGKDQVCPLTPDFGESLLRTPPEARTGLVFVPRQRHGGPGVVGGRPPPVGKVAFRVPSGAKRPQNPRKTRKPLLICTMLGLVGRITGWGSPAILAAARSSRLTERDGYGVSSLGAKRRPRVALKQPSCTQV